MIFSDFGFEERIQQGIDEAGFTIPTPVQEQCFRLLINEHRDIYAQSQTGTGKTAAFLLGIFQLKTVEEKHQNDKAIVVVPTRELAVQIEQEAALLGKYLDIQTLAVFGGVGYTEQENKLSKGIDLLVGTPGRLIDFYKKRIINFKDFGFLVIDEADRLFDMGFLPELRKIFSWMRPKEDRHTLLFSATMNARVGNLAWEFLHNPGEVIIEPEKVTVDTVTQELYHVGKDEKIQLLLGLLNRENPENAVIFTNTQHVAWEVAKRLEINGFNVNYLIGDLPQKKRLKIINNVKKGHHKFLIATDVASRGLHIDELVMVINYDVPLEPELYVHRIGRTARKGNKGKTITMACEEYVYGLAPIEKLLGKKIPVVWADENLLLPDKSAGKKFTSSDRYRDMGKKDKNSMEKAKKQNKRGSNPEKKKNWNNTESGKPKKQSNGKTPLDIKAKRAQSAVSMAAGSLSDSPDESKSDNKTRTIKSRKPIPQRNRKKFTKETKNKESDIDRMEYYRRKYGEDFRSDRIDTLKSNKKPHKKRHKGKQSSNITSSSPKKPTDSKRTETSSSTVSVNSGQAPQKKGFFKRLFRKD